MLIQRSICNSAVINAYNYCVKKHNLENLDWSTNRLRELLKTEFGIIYHKNGPGLDLDDQLEFRDQAHYIEWYMKWI